MNLIQCPAHVVASSLDEGIDFSSVKGILNKEIPAILFKLRTQFNADQECSIFWEMSGEVRKFNYIIHYFAYPKGLAKIALIYTQRLFEGIGFHAGVNFDQQEILLGWEVDCRIKEIRERAMKSLHLAEEIHLAKLLDSFSL